MCYCFAFHRELERRTKWPQAEWILIPRCRRCSLKRRIHILFLSCSELEVKWGDNANIQEELKKSYKNLQTKWVRGPLDGWGEVCLTKRCHSRAAGGWRRRNTGWDECKMGKLCSGALPGIRLNQTDALSQSDNLQQNNSNLLCAKLCQLTPV